MDFRKRDSGLREWTRTAPFLALVRKRPAGSEGLVLMTLYVLMVGTIGILLESTTRELLSSGANCSAVVSSLSFFCGVGERTR